MAAAAAAAMALALSLAPFARAAADEVAETAKAKAPAAGVPTARADSLHRVKPFMVMLRAAAVPGWGQLYNHKYVKAGVVIGGEGFLVFLALNELKKENQAVDRLSAIASADVEAGTDYTLDPAYLGAQNDRDVHRNQKINWIWLGLAAHVLSMVDAYVDANLATFDAEFGPPESAVDLGEKPRLTLAIRTRF